MAGENRPEMEVFNICDNQENNDPAHQGNTARRPSVTTNLDGDGQRWYRRYFIIGGTILVIALIISVIYNIILSVKSQDCKAALGPSDVFSCTQDWVKEGEVAYFFSKVDANWSFSQSNCSSCDGSLLVIEDIEEMEFIKKHRGPAEYWLGLWREKGQAPWKRMNGSVFNDWYPIQNKEGLCAYLNDQVVTSTWCGNIRYWICKKLLHGS